MCGIAGFRGEDARRQTAGMIELLQSRGPDGTGLWEGPGICLAHARLKVTGDCPQPASAGKMVFVFNGEIFNYRDFGPCTSDTEAVAGLLAGGVDAFAKAAPSLDGDYALAAWDGESLALIRDPLGVKPLFYGTAPGGFCFASERKALRRAGAGEIRALAPGGLLVDGAEQGRIDLPAAGPAITDEGEAVRLLDEALAAAVRARLHPDAAVAFSGGLDSALVGALAAKAPLLTVGMAGSHDLKAAERAARLMEAGDRHSIYPISAQEIEEALPGVVYAIESAEPLQVSIALPLYLLAQRAREDGYRVLISGQGADELFAGYARYEAAGAALGGMLDRDLRRLAEANLERDDAATMAHGVELRVPYLARQVVAVARRTGPDLKLRANGKGYIRKYVLRKVAEKHLPGEVAAAPKKAIQYGTSVQRALERLAKARGCGLPDFLDSVYRDVLT